MIRLVLPLCLLACLTAQAQGPLAAMLEKRRVTVAASAPVEWAPPSNCVLWIQGFTAQMITNASIPDLSGMGHSLTTTVAITNRGSIVDTDAIQGNGVSSTWTIPYLGKAISNCTVVAICTPALAINKQFFSLSDYNEAGWDLIRLGLVYSAGYSTTESLIFTGAGSVAAPASLSTLGGSNTYACVALTFELNNARAWYNGIHGTEDTSCNFLVTSNRAAYSTFLSYGPTYFSNQKIKKLWFFDRTLSSNEIVNIQANNMP